MVICELPTIRHNNDSPQLNQYDNDSPQLNNDSPQLFYYDYILIILILTIIMIKYDQGTWFISLWYDIFITC